MTIKIEAYEFGDKSLYTDLLPHPVMRSENEIFLEAYYFENAEIIGNEIVSGENLILFYRTNVEIDEKSFCNDFKPKYDGFSILYNYTLKGNDQHLAILKKSLPENSISSVWPVYD